MIRFRLAQPMRVRLVVRGPAPSCRVLGVIRARGKAGANKILFAGRLRGHPLAPGVYSLTLAQPAQPGANTVLVRVVRPGHAVALRTVRRRAADCQSTLAHRPDASLALTATSALAGRGGTPTRPAKPAKTAVLGVKASSIDRLRGVGSAGSDAIARLPTPVGVALLIAFLLAIGATTVLVVRFLRGSWNP